MNTESNNVSSSIPLVGDAIGAAQGTDSIADAVHGTTAAPETEAVAGDTSSTEGTEQAAPAAKKVDTITPTMLVLAFVVLMAVVFAVVFSVSYLLVLLFGEIAGNLIAAAIYFALSVWIMKSETANSMVRTYLGWFMTVDKSEAQAAAAADVAANFAAQAPAEEAAFQGAVPA